MAYMLAKEDLSTLKFESLLLGTEAFNITDDLTATVNIGVEEYRSKDAAREFILCLGDVVRDSILEDVRLSPAYAIGVDESTDISTVEEMIMYTWFLKSGIPMVRFLGLYAMPKADAESISSTIQEKVLGYDLDESKLLAFGSDGASVMTRTSQRSSGATRKKQHYRGNPISRKADKGCIVVSGMLDIIEDIVDSEDVEAETEALVDEAVAEEDDESADESGWCTDIFQPGEGWLVQTTAPNCLAHASLKKTAKIAHRFKNKWFTGKYKYISFTGEYKGLKAVYYGDDKLLYFHSLNLDEYGPDKMWCILKKEPKKKQSIED
ncbi:hypothetical protein CYMTET_12796 [Cymbomonas tetramitiformis]|uniref:DUF4371 domain-containing protein n=1 Tax=Cymbomonas tetramitiformis TaxID=36881 RepID=A0AAE0GJR9_9CHLO|nr:hypothetical protein CYMTET_12796 [Cymbomonas tetramitiformis]